jgi:flagellar hook protein FlgE
MGLTTSLYTGATGLTAHGDAISVVGDNIANVSTIGYKSSRAGFEDVLGGTVPGGDRLGTGVRMSGVESRFTQGTFLATGGSLDMAINGKGFFSVKNVQGATFYTRDGRFHLDSNGKLVNTDGHGVQGFTISATGVQAVATSDLLLAGAQIQPATTSKVSMVLNLDASAAVNPGGAAFDMTSDTTMSNTSNFSTSVTIFDTVGKSHRVNVFFRKTVASPPAWEYHAMIDGNETASPVATTPERIGTGTLTFDTSGRLNIEAKTPSAVTFTGAAAQTIDFDFGDAITTDSGTGLKGATQFASASNVVAITQDGFGSGSLLDVAVSDDGTIIGQFSNGQKRNMARVALASFANEHGLKRAGDAMFTESEKSGQPLVSPAGTGGRGTIASASLEASNVDLGSELVTLIAFQRAFQSNARTISTADDMLQEISNLKR